MAYVATRGGENAIQQAERLFHELRGTLSGDYVRSLMETMPYLIDRVMGEASLYAPELAALAIAQSGGDLYEAVLLLRAYRSTQPRLFYAKPVVPEEMLTVRRISAAFKDIPGGQILGPTLDYSHRLLNMAILDAEMENKTPVEAADQPAPTGYPRVADWQRGQGLVAPLPEQSAVDPQSIPDVTRDPIMFPTPRAHRLQSLARADTGGTLSLGYASMRGYGLTHPTVNEVRLAYADVKITHPLTGTEFSIGRVRVSQAEVVSTGGGTPEQPGLELGFAATLGWNEVKIIAASMLDQEMGKPDPHPAHKEEFVLYHTEPVESSGFCIHYKLPHYVTFASSMDTIRDVRENSTRRMHEGMFVQTLLKPGQKPVNELAEPTPS
ncbi:MAG: carbon-phosphorus lyase complex subunit PhnI [Caldilineaceae bacterium]|nr:carbon-phosphorus lyase complex subunit PhnI [Caldilineaceae bacterium]